MGNMKRKRESLRTSLFKNSVSQNSISSVKSSSAIPTGFQEKASSTLSSSSSTSSLKFKSKLLNVSTTSANIMSLDDAESALARLTAKPVPSVPDMKNSNLRPPLTPLKN